MFKQLPRASDGTGQQVLITWGWGPARVRGAVLGAGESSADPLGLSQGQMDISWFTNMQNSSSDLGSDGAP